MIPNELLDKMTAFFQAREPEVFYKTHYELARLEGSPCREPRLWKEYITQPEVSEYINREFDLINMAEMRKVTKDISSRASSVGTAQTLTALMKMMEDQGQKEGPHIVYTYVPLNPEEEHAPNVVKLDDDPFRRDDV